MKIKLDNLSDRAGCVLVTSHDVAAARDDQSIAGSRWEVADGALAYAMPTDSFGLLAELKAEGYDVDDSEYSPPDEDPPWPLASRWPQRKPAELLKPFHNELLGQPVPLEEQDVYCPGCDHRILPGQDVKSLPSDDPWKELWHRACLKEAIT